MTKIGNVSLRAMARGGYLLSIDDESLSSPHNLTFTDDELRNLFYVVTGAVHEYKFFELNDELEHELGLQIDEIHREMELEKLTK